MPTVLVYFPSIKIVKPVNNKSTL